MSNHGTFLTRRDAMYAETVGGLAGNALTAPPAVAVTPSGGARPAKGTAVIGPWPAMGSALLAVLGAMALWYGSASEHHFMPVPHAGLGARTGLTALPLQAQRAIAGILSARDSAYRVVGAGGTFEAWNPAQRLRARFDRTGVLVSSDALRLGLSVRGFGYGSALRRLRPATPQVAANRVTYAHESLSEWYSNGLPGLEQGFTISRAAARPGDGPLTLALALAGDARAALGPRGQSVTFERSGSPGLRYGGLVATDQRGRTLHSWLELRQGRLFIRVDARDARYPLRIDPMIEQQKIVPPEAGGSEAFFGSSVALSADGNTALIGHLSESDPLGAAWVFTRSGGLWALQQKIVPTDATGTFQFFGQSVALSADGNTALIGGGGFEQGFNGAAWVFTRSGGLWALQQKIVPTDESDPRFSSLFGVSVALSADGDTALIGGNADSEGMGAAWVYTRSGSEWIEQQKMIPPDEYAPDPRAQFGRAVALSADGNTALIAGPRDHYELGAVWIYTRSGAEWTEQQKIVPTEGEQAVNWFGSALAVSSAGTTALIGNPALGHSAGAAWVYVRSGSEWTLQQKIVPADEQVTPNGAAPPVSDFGDAVALSSDGTTALIGGPGDGRTVTVSQGSNGPEVHYGAPNIGAAWVYQRAGSTWTEQQKIVPDDEAGSRGSAFGNSAALSPDENTALIGGSGDGEGLGAAWVFVTAPPQVYDNFARLSTDKVGVLGWGPLKIAAPFVETEIECVALGFGDTSNEGSPRPLGRGQILGFTAQGDASPTGGGAERECSSKRGTEAVEAWATDEPTLAQTGATGEHQGALSVPWSVELRCGEREEQQTTIARIGVPAGVAANPGCASEGGELSEVTTEEEEREGCYAATVPEGCIKVNIVEPSLGLETVFEGSLHLLVRNGSGNGLNPSRWIAGGQVSGMLRQLGAFASTATVTGEIKISGLGDSELIQAK